MRPHHIKHLLLALIYAIAMGAGIRTAKADCCIVLPSYPSNVLSIFITDYVSPDTLFDFTITNGTLIPPGTYGGWCIDANDAIDPRQGNTVNGTVYTGELLSTCDTNELAQIPNHGGNPPVGPPPITSVATWHELNYLINHRPTNDYWDVQVAINSIIGGPPVYNGDGNPADDAYPTINTNVVQTLVSNTIANAASWHAQCGDKVAIVYVVNPPTANTLEQLVILEVPCCSISFTMIPTNMYLGCNPTNIPVCQSPVNTNLVNAVSCCGHPVNITCSSSDSMLNCTTYRTFIYTATDAYGYSATAMYTVSWTTNTNAPVIVSVPAGGSANPTNLPTDASIQAQVVATNGCGGAITITVTHVDSGTCVITRTFTITATDSCGNTSAPVMVVYTWGTPCEGIGKGDTATIGFWHNKNGQALIDAQLPPTALGNWLATNFPYLYGADAGANDLAGKKDPAVAALFLQFFDVSGQKTDAQIMAGALAAFVTDPSLGGTTAIGYGFNVTPGGTGSKTYNVGSDGTAIGLMNNTSYTVLQLLEQANLDMQNGTFNANAFNDIFNNINQGGDIN